MLVCEKPLALAFAYFTVIMFCGIEARPGIPTVLSQLEFPSTAAESGANSSCQQDPPPSLARGSQAQGPFTYSRTIPLKLLRIQ